MNNDQYVDTYLNETVEIVNKIDRTQISNFISEIEKLKNSDGRLFIIGVGGSAANASHAVNDFRKIVGIESYTPTDNVSELTARINDDSWEDSIVAWLRVSKMCQDDALLVLSVGGGSETTSQNLVRAMRYANDLNVKILSIVSRHGGEARKLSNCCVHIPVISQNRVTPHAEGWQAVIWHLVVSAFMEKR
jgi:D-sedoheptulose 7-phosphate isomerase